MHKLSGAQAKLGLKLCVPKLELGDEKKRVEIRRYAAIVFS